jgi:hypothetical protein
MFEIKIGADISPVSTLEVGIAESFSRAYVSPRF